MQAARVRKLLGLKFVPKPKPKINTEDSIDVLGWLIDTANIVQNASSVCAFPQIQYAVAALSVLLQCVQRVRKNNDDYEELLSRVKIILEALRRVVDDSDEEMCSRMNTVFLEFHTSLREIVREVNSQRKSNDKWIKQFLHSHGVSQAIDQLRMKFDDLRLNVLVTASFAHHSSMKEQFSKLDQKLDVEIESQAVVAVETQASLSNLQYQSQTLHGEAQKQTRLMGQHQTELITAFAMQGQRMRENLRGQDMLATQHHIQTTNNLRDHQSWLQSTLHDQTQLALRQHGEVLEAVKQVVSPPSTSSDDELEEYEENFQVFKQSQWKPKRTIRSSDEEEGSWMSTDPQVLVIDQTSIVGNVKYRVRTFKAAEHNKPEHKDAAFRAFKEHLHLHSSTRMPFLPELSGFSKFKHSPSLFFEEHDEEFVPWPDYQYEDELSKTLLLFKVNLVEEDARKYMAIHMGMHPARNKEGNRIPESILIGPGGKVKLLGWTSVSRPRVKFDPAAVSLKLLDHNLDLVAARLKRLSNRQQVLRDFIASGAAFLNIKRRRVVDNPLIDYHSHLGFLYCTCCVGSQSVRAKWTPHINFSVSATYDDQTSTATDLDVVLEPKSHRIHCAKVSVAPGITTISSIMFLQSYEPVDISIMYHTSANPHHISFEHLSEFHNRFSVRYFPLLEKHTPIPQLYILIHPCLNQYGKPFFQLRFEFAGQIGITPFEAESKGIFVERLGEECLFREFSAGQEHFPLLCTHMELDPFKEYYPQALEEQGVKVFDDNHPDLGLVGDDEEYGHPSHPSAEDESTAYYFPK